MAVGLWAFYIYSAFAGDLCLLILFYVSKGRRCL